MPVLRDTINRYAWVNEIEAWTVGVVEGRTVDEVIRVYGGSPDSPMGDYTFFQMAEPQGPGEPESLRHHLQAFEVGSHIVTMEENGWSGSHPE
ncbi:MAG: hypothetical protein M3443_16270, partial [Actinomycetota bacterium]|nr:hypothetical protein [Actinomycetota bacterium]